jgi:hypothetical protein
MSKTLQIKKTTLEKIVKSLFTINSVSIQSNFDHIRNLIFREMSDNTIEKVAELMLTDEPYELVYPGDYVKVTPPSYHLGSEYEKDILIDMKLYPGEDMVYALVVGDSSWSSSAEYNPLYSRLKIKYVYHDDKKNIVYKEDTVNPLELIKITKHDSLILQEAINIIHKPVKDAKIITGTDQITL